MNWLESEAERMVSMHGGGDLDEGVDVMLGDLKIKALLAMLRAEKASLNEVLQHLPMWLQNFVNAPDFAKHCNDRFDAMDVDQSGEVDPLELAPVLQGMTE